MSTPNENSASVEISTDDDNGQATTHTHVVENGKTVEDETHPGSGADVSITS